MRKIKGGFIELSGYYKPLMFIGSIMSAYIFMLAMLANNPEITKNIKEKFKSTQIETLPIANPIENIDTTISKTFIELLQNKNCKSYSNIIQDIIKELGEEDKKKWLDEYKKITSRNLFPSENNIGIWNEKSKRFFNMICNNNWKNSEVEILYDDLLNMGRTLNGVDPDIFNKTYLKIYKRLYENYNKKDEKRGEKRGEIPGEIKIAVDAEAVDAKADQVRDNNAPSTVNNS